MFMSIHQACFSVVPVSLTPDEIFKPKVQESLQPLIFAHLPTSFASHIADEKS